MSTTLFLYRIINHRAIFSAPKRIRKKSQKFGTNEHDFSTIKDHY